MFDAVPIPESLNGGSSNLVASAASCSSSSIN